MFPYLYFLVSNLVSSLEVEMPEMMYGVFIPVIRAACPSVLTVAPNNITCELQNRSLLSAQFSSFYTRNSTKLLSIVL